MYIMDKKAMWSLAAKNGLILSSITVVIASLTTFINMPSSVSMTLNVAKFVGIIYLLYFFMKQYAEDLDFVSYGESFKYGLTLCFLSSIVCTVFSLITFFYLEPAALDNAIETTMFMLEQSGMGDTMDYDTLRAMILKILPISFFIGYLIYGLIYTSIIAIFTRKDEIFPNSQDV